MKNAFFAVMIAVAIGGCKGGSPDEQAEIQCWSGGVMIYSGVSADPVKYGNIFRDKADGKVKEVSGDCVISYK